MRTLEAWIDWSLTDAHRRQWWLHPQLVIPVVFQITAFSVMAWCLS